MKAGLDTKPDSAYNDDVFRHYHFPKRYHALVEKSVGDWAVLRRPRAGGGDLAYFAAAFVEKLEPDPFATSMYYARFRDFFQFDRNVA